MRKSVLSLCLVVACGGDGSEEDADDSGTTMGTASTSGGTLGTTTAGSSSSNGSTAPTGTSTTGGTDSSGSTGTGGTDTAGPPSPLSWSPPENISMSVEFSDLRLNWGNALAMTDAGSVHAVWREVTDPSATPVVAKVAYRRLDGAGWGTVVDLEGPQSGTGHPKIATSGDYVYTTWHRYDPTGTDILQFDVSASDGAAGSFAGPQTIVSGIEVVTNPLAELSTGPSITADGEWVHVVYTDDRADAPCSNVTEVYMQSSGDRGAQWDGARQISDQDCRSSWTATVTASGGTVHAAWTDERDHVMDCGLDSISCVEEAYYRRLQDNGTTPDPADVALTMGAPWDTTQSWAGNIIAFDDDVHYAWMDNAGGDDFEVHHLRSSDRGATWPNAPSQVTSHAAGCGAVRPTLTADGTDLHLVWFEICGDASTVFHAWSRDFGDTWSEPSDVTSGTSTFAIQPYVVARAGEVHVMWSDQAEILYASSQ